MGPPGSLRPASAALLWDTHPPPQTPGSGPLLRVKETHASGPDPGSRELCSASRGSRNIRGQKGPVQLDHSPLCRWETEAQRALGPGMAPQGARGKRTLSSAP